MTVVYMWITLWILWIFRRNFLQKVTEGSSYPRKGVTDAGK